MSSDNEKTANNVIDALQRILLRGVLNPGIKYPHAVMPDGCVTEDLERLCEKPHRVRHKAEFYDAASFVEYVAHFGGKDSIVYVLPVRSVSGNTTIIRCILDAHKSSEPSWATHEATLYVMASPEYLVWSGKNGQFMGQADFCEFLEDYACDVTSPSSAELVSLARNMRVKQNIDVKAAVNLETGETELQYIEKHDAESGRSAGKGTFRVPEKIKLNIPLFLGDNPIELEASFRYRVGGPAVAFAYRIPRLEQIIMNRVKEMAAGVAKELKSAKIALIWHGSGQYHHNK